MMSRQPSVVAEVVSKIPLLDGLKLYSCPQLALVLYYSTGFPDFVNLRKYGLKIFSVIKSKGTYFPSECKNPIITSNTIPNAIA